jgi:hypothetical protein
MSRVGFKKLAKQLAKRGAKTPNALAAWIGRKKFGKRGMARRAVAGKKRR